MRDDFEPVPQETLAGALRVVRRLISAGMDVVDDLLDPVVAKLHGPPSAPGR